MRGYFGVGLVSPKHSVNVGSAMRAVGCWGASFLAISGNRRYKKSCTDTMKTYRHIPLFQTKDMHGAIPYDCVPVAVEVDGDICLPNYKHPERAIYIFGPEDGSLGRRVTEYCRDIIKIPAGCLNLAAAINVVLYDRVAKGLLNSDIDAKTEKE